MAVCDPGTMSFHLSYCRQQDVGLDLHSAGQTLRLLLLSPWTDLPTHAHTALCSRPRVLSPIHLLSEDFRGQVTSQIWVSLGDFSSSYDLPANLDIPPQPFFLLSPLLERKGSKSWDFVYVVH